jgi:dTDP-glucose 4,6-dehydratase
MRLLVTGGCGFIGSNFIHHVLHRAGVGSPCCPDEARYGDAHPDPDTRILNLDSLTYAADPARLAEVQRLPQYRFVRADIADPEAVEKAVASFKPDAIVHFAAESHVDRSIEAGDVFVRTNAVGTQTLLDAARRHDVGRFLHVSTDEVYGSIDRGSFSEGDPLHPSSPYSASKAASDLLALAHHTTYGLPVQVTRCTNNFGPRQNAEKLVPKTIALALRGEPIPIYGTGKNVRDWLYVKDHCSAILALLGQRKWGEVYNIAAQDERTNLEVVRAILEAMGKPGHPLKFVADRPGHDWRYSLDDRKLRALGWMPRMPFGEGLAHTVQSARAEAAA